MAEPISAPKSVGSHNDKFGKAEECSMNSLIGASGLLFYSYFEFSSNRGCIKKK